MKSVSPLVREYRHSIMIHVCDTEDVGQNIKHQCGEFLADLDFSRVSSHLAVFISVRFFFTIGIYYQGGSRAAYRSAAMYDSKLCRAFRTQTFSPEFLVCSMRSIYFPRRCSSGCVYICQNL